MSSERVASIKFQNVLRLRHYYPTEITLIYCPIYSFLLFFIIGLPQISCLLLAILSTVQIFLYYQREKKSPLSFNPKRNERKYRLILHRMLVSEKKKANFIYSALSTTSTSLDGKWTVCRLLVFLPNFIGSLSHFPAGHWLQTCIIITEAQLKRELEFFRDVKCEDSVTFSDKNHEIRKH